MALLMMGSQMPLALQPTHVFESPPGIRTFTTDAKLAV